MTTKRDSLAERSMVWVKSSRVVANNTFELIENAGDNVGDDRIIRLHFTDIMVFRPDGSILLDTGGWQTVTTKERMNRFLPDGLGIYQSDGFWYLTYRPDGYVDYDSGAWTVPYIDKMVIPPDYSKPKQDAIALNSVAHQKRMKRLINKMCRKVKELAEAKALPLPDSGDCFLCQIENGADMRNSKVDPLRNQQHIISHLEEGYIHGSLLVNAMLWCGYRMEQLRFVYYIRPEQNLRRYLKARVGLAA